MDDEIIGISNQSGSNMNGAICEFCFEKELILDEIGQYKCNICGHIVESFQSVNLEYNYIKITGQKIKYKV